MAILYLEEDSCKTDLLPFTATRSILDIRIGILTLREKWERILGPGNFQLVGAAPPGETALPANTLPADNSAVETLSTQIKYPWHIFQHNHQALTQDFALLTKGRKSQPIPEEGKTIHSDAIFIEEGARLQHCMLNASTGPIYIGRNAEIMEGALIRGPFALCEGATVKLGTKIYGATTIGPYSIVGGEIKNAVMLGYSNKGHDGYLGDAVVGEWCNLGAGTSNSNLKNTASEVNVWHYHSREYLKAGLKCGLLMGDYSRAAINTSFNTGTVVGVCANVFGEGMPPKFIPNFTWGNKGLSLYEFEKALSDIRNWKKLKNQELTEAEITQLKHIFGQS